MSAYYNEIEPYAAQWLRNLIAAGHIAPGEVDERSIEDVSPDDLRPFRQCHFFAGIGVWSYALRRAGWGDERAVWTGSCPCQPFSTAGKGTGFTDERHLWPAWFHLIRKCHPGSIFGEQVASKDAEPWLDLVQTDLEDLGYAFGAVPFPAAGVGAPHIRDRTYWVAHHHHQGLEGWRQPGRERGAERLAGQSGVVGWVGNSDGARCEGRGFSAYEAASSVEQTNNTGGVGDPGRECDELGRRAGDVGRPPEGEQGEAQEWQRRGDAIANSGTDRGPGPTNGLWRNVDWLYCRDGKWRPVEPGTFPLAHGATQRVGRLRAYGNAIVAAQAEEFIRAAMSCIP